MVAERIEPYRIWKQLRVFEHGDINQPGRAVDTVLEDVRSRGIEMQALSERGLIFGERYAVSGFDVVLRSEG